MKEYKKRKCFIFTMMDDIIINICHYEWDLFVKTASKQLLDSL